LSVPADSASKPFVQLFRQTPIQVCQEPDFPTAAWRKMLQNCVSNPLTALVGRGLEILAEPLYRDWAERILAEALPIAQAEGAALGADEPSRILEWLASYPRGTRTSMLQDYEGGKRLEIEALNGTLVELGRRYGLPT
jgi:2-dehydropantoate 2-reductase